MCCRIPFLRRFLFVVLRCDEVEAICEKCKRLYFLCLLIIRMVRQPSDRNHCRDHLSIAQQPTEEPMKTETVIALVWPVRAVAAEDWGVQLVSRVITVALKNLTAL